MKNKVIIAIVLPLLLLSSCDFFAFRATESHEVSVYNLDLLTEDNEDISNALQANIKARFVSGREYIPYLTFKQYASLYKPHLAEGMVSEVKGNSTTLTWSVSHEDSLYFVTEINFSTKEVLIAGNLEAAFKEDDNPQDIAALMYGMHDRYESYFLPSAVNYATYSFSNIKLDYFSYGGEYYLPLSFLDLTFSYDTGVYFFYNYHAIYSTHDADAFSEKTFKREGANYSVDSEMEQIHVDYLMPKYLKDFNANMFFYLMNNFYGFGDAITDFSRSMLNQKPSMAQFCKNHGVYNDLFSSSASVRSQAYSDALSYLDDNHTAIVSANATWGEDSFSRFKYATGCKARSSLRQSLIEKRNSAYEGKGKPGETVLYSADGKTAMYLFDSFIFGTSDEVFNEDGTINMESAVKTDSFFNLIDTFQKIKAHGGVQNIVLDTATNGGGVLGVMMKLLALLSNDNEGVIFYMDSATNQVAEATINVDINHDGIYDTEDCFGDDFNFYILTSDCSFSCGNAFPCFAKYNNIAKIIGQKSGGGECAVAIHFLPNSQYVYHSSSLHLGEYDVAYNIFTGYEAGAEPDIYLDDTASWFDVDNLNASIQRYENQTN